MAEKEKRKGGFQTPDKAALGLSAPSGHNQIGGIPSGEQFLNVLVNGSGVVIANGGAHPTLPQVVALTNDATDYLDGTGAFSKPPSGGATFIPKYRTTDGTPVNNSTVLVADDALKFDVGANEVWAFRGLIFWQNSFGFTKINFDFTGPAAPSSVSIYFSDYIGDDSTLTAFSSNLVDDGNGGLSGAGPDVNAARIEGLIINGANAGTVQLRSAQASAAMADQTILKDSFIIAQKLSA